MAYFYCPEHEVAYQQFNQFKGHWTITHHGAPRPKPEDVSVDEVPSTATLKPPPAAKRQETLPPPSQDEQIEVERPRTERRPSPSEEQDWDEVPEETLDPAVAHLEQLLIGIGVLSAQRRTILAGYQNFAMLREHSTNLSNFILTQLDPKLRNLVPMVVNEMFPRPGPEDTEPAYIYDDYDRRRYASWPRHWDDRPRYGRRDPWLWEPDGPPYPGFRGQALSKEPDPVVTALQEQNKLILAELKETREEAERDRRERLEEQKQAQIDGKFAALQGEIAQLGRDLAGIVSFFREETSKGRQAVETSATDKLSGEITSLRERIESEKDSRFEAALENLQGEKTKLENSIESLRTAVAAGQTGKTTEDLVSQVAPLIIDKVDNVGNTVKGELAGIREAITDGKGPAVAFPRPKAQDLVQDARKIAEARGLEREILLAAGQVG